MVIVPPDPRGRIVAGGDAREGTRARIAARVMVSLGMVKKKNGSSGAGARAP